MNKSLVLIALLGAALIGSAFFLAHHKTNVSELSVDNETVKLYNEWKHTYNKKFANPAVDAYRLQVFASNLELVKENTNYGINQFMDLTSAEFSETYLTLTVESETNAEDIPVNGDINWVTNGKVTKVKNQGSCGSCWAFSTTGSVESALIIANQETTSIDLSEQQLVDCSTSYGNNGCNGGLMNNAFKYIQAKNITTEALYPYKAVDQKCKSTGGKYTISGYKTVTATTSALLTALAKGPISVAVDATNWQLYKTGVFSNCGTSLNHGVLLVGFQKNAWLVKNSWGTSWGQSGYIQLKNGNTCGIANVASYPIAPTPK